MTAFVNEKSVVREIWGKADTVIFIFAGAAAEFALNKAVDWLYYTGKLPADPIGRLFSTVAYARSIVFSETTAANNAIDKITSIHKVVEANRKASIPDWAYRDVLYMLIHYSVASYELLERKLSPNEKEEVFDVFYRMGTRMQIMELPKNYTAWEKSYDHHLMNDLEKSAYTIDLFNQYKKHLGSTRYFLLTEAQKCLVPVRVRELLGFKKTSFINFILPVYKIFRLLHLDGIIKSLILPSKYKAQINALDVR
ncbi:MAG: hypothetical protein JWN76_2022 [Chitinophagaceae bacterium]|nr:hypothetical protein [Chitinophagaceae bacterium]